MTNVNQTYRRLSSEGGFFFPLATEALARRFHEVYQREAERQAEQGADEMRHPDDYDELSEHTKDYDRALAKFVLEEIVPSTKAREFEDTLRLLSV